MRGPNQKIFLTFLVLSFLLAPSSLQAADFQTALVKTVVAVDNFTGKVVGVSDGDTISVMREGKAVKVRLHGIDCPEKGQPYGMRAKQYTSEMAFGKEVTVQIKTTDRYGRIVGEVILPSGLSLNKELVRAGLAWWYHKFAANDQTLRVLEAEAKTAKRGLWAEKYPIPPWSWRIRDRYYYKKRELGEADVIEKGDGWITFRHEFWKQGSFYYYDGQRKFKCIPEDKLKHVPKNGIWKSFGEGKLCWCIPVEATCFISIEPVGRSDKLYVGEKDGLVSVAVFTDEHLRNHWKTCYRYRNNFSEKLLEVPVYSWIVVFFDEAGRAVSGEKIMGAIIIDGLSDGDSYAPESPIQIACNQGETIVVPIATFGDDYLYEVAIPIEIPAERTWDPTAPGAILKDMLPEKPSD